MSDEKTDTACGAEQNEGRLRCQNHGTVEMTKESRDARKSMRNNVDAGGDVVSNVSDG